MPLAVWQYVATAACWECISSLRSRLAGVSCKLLLVLLCGAALAHCLLLVMDGLWLLWLFRAFS